MDIKITRTDDDFLMEAVNKHGNKIVMDGSEEIGGHNEGMRPMQVLLSSLGGCSAIDVISILKKQKQKIESFEVELEADKIKKDQYTVYKTMTLHFKISGNVDPEKALRAAELSITKYCSVAKALECGSEIVYDMTVNGLLVNKK